MSHEETFYRSFSTAVEFGDIPITRKLPEANRLVICVVFRGETASKERIRCFPEAGVQPALYGDEVKQGPFQLFRTKNPAALSKTFDEM
ncbi:hypothetical protein BDV33DRAFT_196012 [Aspergillus novoparasiticus]|uniref:Uncharacterized protein n=1 Tax=Aspergillus novoparasiticus TaxID=986946 RepID=A0A5N6EAC4_9EURO|nr:hypothetical protein BDV33DRAFT_196012 [Aspergillus novoparasiticus]